jgi:hypothetical protein
MLSCGEEKAGVVGIEEEEEHIVIMRSKTASQKDQEVVSRM